MKRAGFLIGIIATPGQYTCEKCGNEKCGKRFEASFVPDEQTSSSNANN